jgi:hypothetical protein
MNAKARLDTHDGHSARYQEGSGVGQPYEHLLIYPQHFSYFQLNIMGARPTPREFEPVGDYPYELVLRHV